MQHCMTSLTKEMHWKKVLGAGTKGNSYGNGRNDLEEIHAQLMVEGDSLMTAMNQYVKTFISDNYENVLGPSVFMMLCSSLPYPIMTPQIDDIIKDAPYSFKSNKLVREFCLKQKKI